MSRCDPLILNATTVPISRENRAPLFRGASIFARTNSQITANLAREKEEIKVREPRAGDPPVFYTVYVTSI